MGDKEQSRPYLQRALELDPENVHASFMMNQLDL
jgi:hypothetical protein